LQNDHDVVVAAVCGKSIEWSALPIKWKNDSEVAVAAMKRCWMFRSLERCNRTNFWGNLPSQCQANPNMVVTALEDRHLKWEEVPMELVQNHINVALCGLRNNKSVDVDDCPCLLDRNVVKSALEEGDVDSWQWPPRDLQDHREFARSITCFPRDLVLQIFAQFPELAQDQAMWEQIIDTTDEDALYDLMEDCAPNAILSNHDIMLKACGMNNSILKLLPDTLPLATNRSFFETLLAREPTALETMPQSAHQRLFPDLIMKTFVALGQQSDLSLLVVTKIAENIDETLWMDRRFVLRWFEAGLLFVASNAVGDDVVFPSAWCDDNEIFLLIAQHCRKDFRRDSFAIASNSLRSDKEYMLQVLKLDTSLFSCASESLQKDFDVALVAFAGLRSNVEEYFRRSYEENRFDTDQLIDFVNNQFRTQMR